jgi:tetratricopeptide (TPR) repeat protein
MRGEFEQRFGEQCSIIYAEDTTFSGSEVFASLADIEKLATRIGENSRERARVLAVMSELQRRRQEWEDAVAFAQRSFAIQEVSGALSDPQLFDLHYALANSSEAVGDFETAAKHCREAIRLMAAKPGLTEAQRLGIRQSLGRALHEIGAHEEARAVNRSVLADAEVAFGAHDPRLTGVLNNLAQNEYELDDFSAGRVLAPPIATCAPGEETQHRTRHALSTGRPRV